MWDEPREEIRGTGAMYTYQKKSWFIQTAGRWPWKLAAGKECVTTHLPNGLAFKMDSSQLANPNLVGRRREAFVGRQAWAFC